MKNMLTRSITAAVMIGLASAIPSVADQPPDAQDSTSASQQKIRHFTGNLTALNAVEKTASVKTFGLTRNFVIADTCKFSLENRPTASMSELRPGQKVEVRYEKVRGVLIAREILQHNMTYEGHVTGLDPDGRTITVKHGAFKRVFVIAENCSILLKDHKSGSLDDVKVGHMVTIVYEKDSDTPSARQIEQRDAMFVGTIRAIDAGSRTVKARTLFGERQFHLANNCKIVVEGKPDARLSDLRIGDNIAVSYEDADGVLVANRIGRDALTPKTEEAQAASRH